MAISRKYLWCLSFWLLYIATQSQIAEEFFIQNLCVSKTTCQECIKTKSCAWCMQPDFGDRPRCFQPGHTVFGSCPEELIWNPDNEQRVIVNRELTRAGDRTGDGTTVSDVTGRDQIVQISPQRVSLKLRINEKHRLHMKYSQVEDYPVDLYFLMDLSKPMEDDKAKLFTLGDLISDTMKNITANFRLGFGSFEAPYSYHNHMPLSSNTKKFSLGGVNAPNDNECHLDDRGFYTYSTIQDYPSISQINHKVKQNYINVIFAVTAQQIEVYEELSKHIVGSSIGILSNDSLNVVELIREEYSKISSSIEMKDNASSSVKVTYYSACLRDGSPIQTSKCNGLKVGDEVSFTAEIVVTSCPQNPRDWFQTFQIYPVGINESLIIDLEMLCNCPCERPGQSTYEEKSQKCNKVGTYKCGVCDCDGGHFGQHCECSISRAVSFGEIELSCRQDNVTTVDCSGRGTCVCGQCECEKRPNPEEIISGMFCECDNFSCDRHNQLLCAGPDHGTCDCGNCVCKPGWTGSACDCKASNETCIPVDGGEVCSGHGVCECGVCKCKATEEGRFSGKYCEKCPTCSGRCHELKDCVQCQMYKSGQLDHDACIRNCTTFVPIGVDPLNCDEEKIGNKCTFYDKDDCKYQFCYIEKEDNKIEVRAKVQLECSANGY